MDDSICIREIRCADLAAVLAINSEAQPAVSHLDAGTATALIFMTSIAWVADLGGRVAGYQIGFLPESGYDGQDFEWFKQRRGSFIYVDQIAIASSFRGQGVGHSLYEALGRWAVGHSCPMIICEVNVEPPNPGSLAFHKTCGFAEIGRLSVLDGREVALLECRSHLG